MQLGPLPALPCTQWLYPIDTHPTESCQVERDRLCQMADAHGGCPDEEGPVGCHLWCGHEATWPAERKDCQIVEMQVW